MKRTVIHLFTDKTFYLPIGITAGILISLVASYILHVPDIGNLILLSTVLVGSMDLAKSTIFSLLRKQFALDYIALSAITVGIFSHEYLVSAVIALMLSGGNALESFGMNKAKESLTALADRIPNTVTMWMHDKPGNTKRIEDVQVGEQIAIRKGEVIPLDGVLISGYALTDESSLTGEPYTFEKQAGDLIRSGTINVGNLLILTVTTTNKTSTYHRIIQIVKEAQQQKAPLIRLADRYSTVFTLLTAIIGTIAYALSGSWERVLSVLVIATPCPLILATPIALMGGLNAAAKRRIIFKNLSNLEVASRVTALVFDKTGTLTVGKPSVTDMKILLKTMDSSRILGIAEALERNSLHPYAKSLLQYAKKHTVTTYHAQNIHEELGQGISGYIQNHRYTIRKIPNPQTVEVELMQEKTPIARFTFDDKIKTDSKHMLRSFTSDGYALHMFTGDKEKNAKKLLQEIGGELSIRADLTPEQKREGIEELKRQGCITAMIGDGINDAPALASADIGMVFSHDEHTASTEAADVVFLGGDLQSVFHALRISHEAVFIAKQSIIVGMGLSICGMVAATFGFIPALVGASLQEIIDVIVILNALRASRYTRGVTRA